MVLTIPIFGAAFFVYGVNGWGRWASIALLTLWLILAGASALRQEKRDAVEPVKRAPKTRLQWAAKLMLLLAPVPFFIRALWLDQTSAPDEIVKNWRDGAMLVWLICFPLTWVVDWTASKLRPKS